MVIAMDANNIAKLANCASELGLYPNVLVRLEDLADAVKRDALFTEKHLIALSLISNTPASPMVVIVVHHPLDFEQAFAKKVARDIAGMPVLLACIEELITLKKEAGREQDLSDIAHLEWFLHERN